MIHVYTVGWKMNCLVEGVIQPNLYTMNTVECSCLHTACILHVCMYVVLIQTNGSIVNSLQASL